jgi:biotin carboxylase
MMSAAPWLVAVGAGRWQLPGIRAARTAGLKVLALDGDRDAVGLAQADAAEVIDITDAHAVVAAVLARGIVPSGAVSLISDAGMAAAAALRDRFNLPGPGGEVAANLTNKIRQRRLWTAAALPTPDWWAVTDDAAPAVTVNSQTGRIIVKPADSAGSRGISVISTTEELAPAIRHARAASRTKTCVVERFIKGTEFTVEGFSVGGKLTALALTQKRKVPGTNDTVAIELGPPTIAGHLLARMVEITQAALAALGYTDGPSHTELLCTDEERIFLVETAGRGGGFMVAEGLVPMVSGVDLNLASVRSAVGQDPGLPERFTRRPVTLRFVPTRSGTIRSVSGFEGANAHPGVVAAPLVKVGDTVGPAIADGNRLAYILAAGDTPADAYRVGGEVEAMISFDIDTARS